MDRSDMLKRILYPKCKTAIEFKFDSLRANPILSYITIQDIIQLNKIATSIKLSSKPQEKYVMIDRILTARGFKKMASGTNRVTYRYLNDYSIVLKVAIDKVGLSDNGNEYRNQHLLKPFVTKCFEVSPCGTVGLFERVVPITSREEFICISDDVFDLINNLIGKYVLEDIGEKFYMNYGLRDGFGPVLLDYPYVFELDGRKLICNVPEPMEPMGYCGGEIDYDLGYNNLICTKCGKRYLATELKSEEKSDKPKIIIKGEDIMMKCTLMRGDEVVSRLNSDNHIATNTIKSRKEVSRLRTRLTTESEPKEDNEIPKYELKTRDKVHLKVSLRGHRKSKDIDKVARAKEAAMDRNIEKIQVSFDKPNKPEVTEVKSNFKCNLETPEPEQKTETKSISLDSILSPKEENRIVFSSSYIDLVKESYSTENVTLVAINSKGEIWDAVTDELIGYTNSDSNPSEDKETDHPSDEKEVVEEILERVETEVEPAPTDHVDAVVEDEEYSYAYKDEDDDSSIGSMIGEQLVMFNGQSNTGYKTERISSPIPNYFAATPTVEEKKDQKEIPSLTIHPRKNKDQKEITATADQLNEY